MLKLKKIKLKRKSVLLLLFLFFVILFLIFRSKNYEMKYQRENVSIMESFNKKEKMYRFLFQLNDKEFVVKFSHSFIHSKKFVSSIEVKEKDNILCIFPKSKKFDFSPLCYQENVLIDSHLVHDEEIIPFNSVVLNTDESEYNDLKIYNLNKKKYFLWNYKGFYVIDGKNNQTISLFSNDVYNIPLSMQVDRYILIADYDSKYTFKKFYVIDSKNNKIRELNLKKEIAFESYFLGTVNKRAYLVDKKEKQEYEIYPKRLLSTNITNNNLGKVFIDDEWQSKSLNTLSSHEESFTYRKIIDFVLEDNILYSVVENYKTKLSNQKVKDIIYSNYKEVYYLVDDQLYYYNQKDGEVLVMTNFEWNFNYKNMIYVF